MLLYGEDQPTAHSSFGVNGGGTAVLVLIKFQSRPVTAATAFKPDMSLYPASREPWNDGGEELVCRTGGAFGFEVFCFGLRARGH